MTNYSKMSDFEINLLITKIIHGEPKTYLSRDDMPKNMNDWPEIVAVHGERISIKNVFDEPKDEYPFDEYQFLAFNPCNNPSDAWPIIVANEIGVVPSKSSNTYAWDLSGGMLKGIKHVDDNPLRAAMIVFLMMKDAEKC